MKTLYIIIFFILLSVLACEDDNIYIIKDQDSVYCWECQHTIYQTRSSAEPLDINSQKRDTIHETFFECNIPEKYIYLVEKDEVVLVDSLYKNFADSLLLFYYRKDSIVIKCNKI